MLQKCPEVGGLGSQSLAATSLMTIRFTVHCATQHIKEAAVMQAYTINEVDSLRCNSLRSNEMAWSASFPVNCQDV